MPDQLFQILRCLSEIESAERLYELFPEEKTGIQIGTLDWGAELRHLLPPEVLD